MTTEELLPPSPQKSHAVSRSAKRVTSTPVVPHGLASSDRVYISIMDKQERGIFHRVRAQFMRELQPVGVLETMLAEHVVVSHFRMLRVFAIDHQIVTSATRRKNTSGETYIDLSALKRLQMITQYERQIERTFRLSLQKLGELRAARRQAECEVLQKMEQESYQGSYERGLLAPPSPDNH